MNIPNRVLSCLPAIALMATLSACGGDKPPASGAPSLPATLPTTAPPTTAPPTSAAPVESTKTAVNKTLRIDVVDHTIKIKNVVRNFPIPDRFSAVKDQKELLLLEFDLEAGDKYTGSLMGTDFRVVTDEGGKGFGSFSVVDAEMTAAGYKPLPRRVGHGESGSGWLAFMVEPIGSTSLTLHYERFPMKLIGSGKTIPGKKFDLPLVS